VVGLEYEHVGGAHAIGNEARAVAEVGKDADAAARCVQQKSNRIGGVVWHGEGVHDHAADLEGLAGLEQAKVERCAVDALDLLAGEPVAVDGDAELGGDVFQSGHVV
jgi:hypothetical protein